MISESVGVNSRGHLTVGGADCVELAGKYETPLYVFDETLIRKSIECFKSAVNKYFKNGNVLYASKAFSCKEMYRIASEEGIGADVVSGGEIYTAVSAGFDPSKLFFHGNNKTPDEIEFALKTGVGRIVADNIGELEMLNETAARLKKKVSVMLRIKPGIDAHTHSYIRTGQIDSKFGFALHNGEAMEAAVRCSKLENLTLTGFHCHIGSQILETEPYADATLVMMGFMADFRKKTGITVSELNLGGGFGVRYVESDTPVPFELFVKKIAAALESASAEYEFPAPEVFVEPGRSVVGPAGVTLYTVGSVKEIKDVRTFVSVDGGMADNPRYAIYHSEYDIEIADRAGEKKEFIATVAGKCCESGDLLQENAAMQTPHPGDTLAVLITGAYNYSMASNYNRIPRPAAVMVKEGKSRVIIKRETYDDLVKNDI